MKRAAAVAAWTYPAMPLRNLLAPYLPMQWLQFIPPTLMAPIVGMQPPPPPGGGSPRAWR